MEDRRAAAAFFGVLVAFKIFTLLLIVVLMASWSTLEFLVATHVLWLCVGLLVASGPAVFWYRLLRVRRRRAALQRSEWQVEDTHRVR
ncbi:MAG: hypothetical protein IRY97_00565 [Thermomicrobiaceae bacterium]|nr:hypothetical protein [Thermomicrobiaceae bacterium]